MQTRRVQAFDLNSSVTISDIYGDEMLGGG